jgi:hypothetical protein
MVKRWFFSVAVVGAVLAAFANGCTSATTTAFDPCPGELTCPNHVCCAPGYPYECNGKCYTAPGPCGGNYTLCTGAAQTGSTGGTGQGNANASDGGTCPSGTTVCGAYCAPAGAVCCASAGHPELSCPSGETCTTSGGCQGGSTSSGGTSSGGTGVPCTQNVHPAWEPGECQAFATCQCTMKACVRIANGGCCSGYDLGWIFIPCDGSGGTSCGNCQNAAASALRQCGCTK